MIRLYVPHDLAPGAELALDHGQSHYLASVMRQGVGDEVLLFNGRDGEWRCAITVITKRAVGLKAAALARPQAMGPDLMLIVALVKRSPLETIVEKSTELGVRSIQLITTDRTNAERARLERLTAIAIEAAEQTGRLDVPQIAEPMKLDRLIGWGISRRVLFCDEAGDAQPVIQALSGSKKGEPWAILIGPEGGFSPAERERLRALPFAVPATLGPRILRADTAAISALTLWQSALGDWTRIDTP